MAPTLAGADGGGGRNPAGLVLLETHPNVCGTLCASGAGTERPVGNANETDLIIAHKSGARFVVRRLTPVECERLMGFPDGWTEYGHDGKPLSDSKRYALLGNSIVVNCLENIMYNITEILKRRRE
jgi:DNA (cytosine-5)-methyltransferase 1